MLGCSDPVHVAVGVTCRLRAGRGHVCACEWTSSRLGCTVPTRWTVWACCSWISTRTEPRCWWRCVLCVCVCVCVGIGVGVEEWDSARLWTVLSLAGGAGQVQRARTGEHFSIARHVRLAMHLIWDHWSTGLLVYWSDASIACVGCVCVGCACGRGVCGRGHERLALTTLAS